MADAGRRGDGCRLAPGFGCGWFVCGLGYGYKCFTDMKYKLSAEIFWPGRLKNSCRQFFGRKIVYNLTESSKSPAGCEKQ